MYFDSVIGVDTKASVVSFHPSNRATNATNLFNLHYSSFSDSGLVDDSSTPQYTPRIIFFTRSPVIPLASSSSPSVSADAQSSVDVASS
jgi:hypothetical protein